MKHWLITHTHRFGNSIVVVASDEEPDSDLVEAYALRVLDYEPDRDDEYLEIAEVEIVTLEQIQTQLALAQAFHKPGEGA